MGWEERRYPTKKIHGELIHVVANEKVEIRRTDATNAQCTTLKSIVAKNPSPHSLHVASFED